MRPIIPKGKRSNEMEILLATVSFLNTRPSGWANYEAMQFSVQSHIKLTAADKEVSRSRPAELKWHMILRNAYRTGQRLGILERQRGGYQLTSPKTRASSNSATADNAAADITAAILRHYLGHSVPKIGEYDDAARKPPNIH
jgi:hypothetical protein